MAAHEFMANREIRRESEVEESTTLIRAGVSGARIKTANSLPPETPRVRVIDALQNVVTPGPTSDEFAAASLATPAAAPIASSGMVGPYHLALEIASGGMATVYLAVHGLEGFQNTVAVKRIHPHLAKDKQFVDMFVDEAHIAARINHPYVCRVFDFGKTRDNSYYIAMEFLRGEPLSRVFRALTPERIESPRHPTIIARLIANLAEGLHAAHTLKDTHGQCLDVVHRDVTPQNLFVLCDGTVRVTDFGIARARVRSHQTEGGRIKGKLSYMSPEQLNQHPVDCRSDLWSLGVVTWELLTGRRLFRASSEGETVMSVLSRPIPPPSRFAGSVPRQLDAIVLRALSRDPELRFASARELARALETFLAAASDTVPTMDVAEWVEQLFPDAAKHSDSLVELAHAVLPPERRQSQRPPSLPVTGPSSSNEHSKEGAPTLRRTSLQDLPLPTDQAGTELNWWRASLLTVALIGGLIFVFSFFRGRHREAAPTPPVAPVETALAKAAPPAPLPSPPPVLVAIPVETATPPVSPAVMQRPVSSSRAAPITAARSKVSAVGTLASAAPKATELDRTGSVQLMTKNGRAEVYAGGRLLGVTPLTLDLPPGTAVLLLKPVAGGDPRVVNVAIRAGAASFVTVSLAAPTGVDSN